MIDLAHTMQNIDVDSIEGLSSSEVLRKLNDEGYNELPSSEKTFSLQNCLGNY